MESLIKATKSPLSFLMGILLKGEYVSIDPEFKTEEETLLEQQMQAKIDKANRMRSMKIKAQQASFDIWMDSVDKNKKLQILENMKVFGLEKMNEQEKDIHLKQYHSDEIWPAELAGMKG